MLFSVIYTKLKATKLSVFVEVSHFFVYFCIRFINKQFMEKKKVLFISQEISPFLPKSEVCLSARGIAQGIQESGKEIRVFTPRFGVINERRHQLHEVIRLSGMNLIIDDTDHPLIIKVASISQARMQVYFIDNEEYFKRKNTVVDENEVEYADNDERSMFFCRGVLETVKKLGWQPDVIHCSGWMTALMPMYLKTSIKMTRILRTQKWFTTCTMMALTIIGMRVFQKNLNLMALAMRL